MTPEVIRKIAITSFFEKVYEKPTGGRLPEHYASSEITYGTRLLRHRPPVILVIMGIPNPETEDPYQYNSLAVNVAEKLDPRPLIITGPHPLHARSREFAREQFRAEIGRAHV